MAVCKPAQSPAEQPLDADLAKGVARALSRVVAHATAEQHHTCFHSKELPPISIGDYASRIARFFECSASCYVLGLMLIDRLVRRHPHVAINQFSCHRLLLTSVVVAAKVHDDRFFTNTFYAQIGGVQVRDLNRMEARFLKLLDWALQVSPEEFATFSHACQALAHEG